MLDCINDVNVWMSSNRLKLNPAKTEFLWCSTPRMIHHVDYITPFVIDSATIAPAKSVKLLGAYIDSELSMTRHVSSTVSTCFYQLRQLKAVRKSLLIEARKKCHLVVRHVTRRLLQRIAGEHNTATGR